MKTNDEAFHYPCMNRHCFFFIIWYVCVIYIVLFSNRDFMSPFSMGLNGYDFLYFIKNKEKRKVALNTYKRRFFFLLLLLLWVFQTFYYLVETWEYFINDRKKHLLFYCAKQGIKPNFSTKVIK